MVSRRRVVVVVVVAAVPGTVVVAVVAVTVRIGVVVAVVVTVAIGVVGDTGAVVIGARAVVVVVVVIVVVVVVRGESLESGRRGPVMNDLRAGWRVRMTVRVARHRVRSGSFEEVQGRWRR